MYLIVGLGNPGEQYHHTRHNLGFDLLDQLLHKLADPTASWQLEKNFKSEVLKTTYKLEGEEYVELILAKPQTFMNNSGEAVAKIANFYKIPRYKIIVIHDELDLLLGRIKIRKGGGAGGHHGVESIIEKLSTPEFIRLRLGIGTTDGFLGEHDRVSFDANKFVMQKFSPQERSKVKSMLKTGVEAIQTLLTQGLEKTQNQFH